jgi:hypothetical protein
VVALALAPRLALAAPPAADPVLKSRFAFEKARKLTESDKWDEACPLFQEAHDLHATGGTAIQLANCYEKTNQPEKAIVYYQFIVDHKDAEKVDERVQIAEQRLAALKPPPATSASTAPPPPPPKPWTARFTPPVLVSLGAGVTGVFVGALFGGLALSEASSVKDHCVGNVCPTSQSSSVDGARAKGWVSTIGFGAGFVGLSVGAVLLAVGSVEPVRAAAPKTGSARRLFATSDGVGVRF